MFVSLILLVFPGKSLCYQLPAMMLPGVTLVVSPLISLMHDQIEHLRSAGIAAHTINASTSVSQMNRIVNDILAEHDDACKLLYVSPEKLAKSKTLLERLSELHDARLLARIVIDEAHCASTWGHDFRPDYAQLSLVKLFAFFSFHFLKK